MYTGTAAFMTAYVGPGRPLDPDRYFFILPAQFGDGFSSSPSNTPPPFDRGAFPPVAISDDVRAQHQLVTEHFGISQLAMVSGWSMGGQQTLEWAVRCPDALKRAVPFAATAKNPDHCAVFCDLHMDALRSDPAFNGGFYDRSTDVHVGLRRHAQAFALMGPTSTGDLFFPPEDISADAARVPGAKFVETGSAWGHFTMFNLREQDTAAIDAIYAEALAS